MYQEFVIIVKIRISIVIIIKMLKYLILFSSFKKIFDITDILLLHIIFLSYNVIYKHFLNLPLSSISDATIIM
jgi:hypothetical protein